MQFAGVHTEVDAVPQALKTINTQSKHLPPSYWLTFSALICCRSAWSIRQAFCRAWRLKRVGLA